MKTLKKYKNSLGREWKIPRTIQAAMPIDAIDENGIARRGNTFSMTVAISDVNYLMADDATKEMYFRKYCDFINTMPPDQVTQVTIVNRVIDMAAMQERLFYEIQHDERDPYREEVNRMLSNKAQKASGFVRERLITLTTEQKSFADAERYFRRQLNDLEVSLRTLGSRVTPLDATARLKIFRDFYRTGEESIEHFDLKETMKNGHSFKDYLCPDKLKFESNHILIGNKYARTIFLLTWPNFLSDELISNLSDFSRQMFITINVLPVTQADAVHEIEKRLLGIDTNIARWQSKQNANKNWSASIPFSYEQQQQETKELLSDLTEHDQHMMFVCVAITHVADTLEQLDDDTAQIKAIGSKKMCYIATATNNQRMGLTSSLPLGVSPLGIWRTLTTSAVAFLTPFQAQDVEDEHGVYYGVNPISGNLIMLDRFKLQNSNSFILGVPGSGKSFVAKREIAMIALSDDADIIVIDPEGEYTPLIRALEGQVVEISDASKEHINPFDMNPEYDEGNYSLKSNFMMSLFELISRDRRLSPTQKSIIDRCTKNTLVGYMNNGYRGNVPTLYDFYYQLKEQSEQEAQDLALEMEYFTTGSLSTFAHETNVDIKRNIVSFDIQKLGRQLHAIGLLVVLDFIFNRITENRESKRKTYVFIDEIYLLFMYENAAEYLYALWKRVRKYNAALTGITQNVSDLLESNTAKTMLSNSELIVMLNQAPSDRDILADLLQLNAVEKIKITDADVGSGLMKVGGSYIPFKDDFPRDTELYRMMTTKPKEAMY